MKLTARQSQVLEIIRRHVDETGYPPTRAEIAEELGFRSANAAEEHLRALARKGAIEMTPGASRGIRIPGLEPKSDDSGLPIMRSWSPMSSVSGRPVSGGSMMILVCDACIGTLRHISPGAMGARRRIWMKPSRTPFAWAVSLSFQ